MGRLAQAKSHTESTNFSTFLNDKEDLPRLSILTNYT